MARIQSWLQRVSFYLGIFLLGAVTSYIVYRLSVKYERTQEIMKVLSSIIDYKLYDSANITVGSILILLVLLFIGNKFAKLVSYRVVDKFLVKSTLNKGAQAAIENLSYYVLVSIFILVALNVAKVPLTVFTLFGGALAIGLGFGSQNILSNFISGIILQIEQPVKVGDIIEVEGIIGTIEHIGGRSTKIISANNTHMVLPNSYLLDKKLINWTLQDNIVRSKISVKVDLSSDLELVEKVLKELLSETPNIMTTPEPRFFLDEIGEYSLDYLIYFWVPIQGTMDRSSIESSFRIQLIKKLRQAGIVLPFPVRQIIQTKEK